MKKSKIKLICVVMLAMLAFVFISNSLQREMNKIRISEKLIDTMPVDNAPPIIAFTTVALGSFRGLLADMLWLRSIRLQDQGQYFEMVQLASWITKLQPRFTGATAYLAWNMAYNISVTCSSFEDRWRWIRKGIELIRDEAIQYNPSDPLLYKELGWIYQHKLGNIMDDANIYYKNQMAIELMKVFGTEIPDWDQLAFAADNPKKLLQDNPSLMKGIIQIGFKDFSGLENDFRMRGNFDIRLKEFIQNPDDLRKLELSIRKKWLKEKFKLDPAKIAGLNKQYGELDWRLPEAHAIYWASLGITYDKTGEININCDRMITQSLNSAFMGGKILIYDEQNFTNFMTIPNLKIADTVRKTFEEAYKRQGSNSFRGALENFMVDAIVILYNFGQYQKAEEYLKHLRELSPNNDKFKMPLDNLVIKEWTEDIQMSTAKQAMDIISGLIYRSCYLLAAGDRNAAAAHERIGDAVYRRYYSDQKASWGRTGLPPFNKIKNDVTKKCLEIFPEKISKMLSQQLSQIESEKKLDNALKEKDNPPNK